MRRGGWRLAVPVALLLTVALASPVTAITWGGDRPLTASRAGYAYRGGLARVSSTVAVAVYEQWTLGSFSVWARRTADSGTTWGTPIILSRPDVGSAGVPAIDSSGSAVDAVWVEGDDIISGYDSIVVYRRSTDGGKTWKNPVQISSTTGRAGLPRVVHAANGRVLVTWTDEVSGTVYVRRSIDSGATWGTTKTLGTTTNKPLSDTTLKEAWPSPADGTGAIYIGYYTSSRTLKYRRSTDGGATWGTAKTITTIGEGSTAPSFAATGSTVLAGYGAISSGDYWTAMRRSTDKGATWSSTIALSPKSGYQAFAPVLSYSSGKFRAVFERCTSNSCFESNTYYRSSTSGATWSTTTKASARNRQYAYPADVEVATKVLVLYVDYESGVGGDVYVRQGS